jgi:predicted amidohydrolase
MLVRIALGQLESGADIRANLAAVDRFAAEAARDGARLLAFPEYATYEKKKVDATFLAVAEPLDGPVCRELADIARRHGIALVAGVVETSEEPGRAYNTLVAFGSDGGRLASYRKIHLSVPGTCQVAGRRRRAGPAGLLVLGAGRAQDGAMAGAERRTGNREQRVRGGGVPGSACVRGAERAGGPDGYC